MENYNIEINSIKMLKYKIKQGEIEGNSAYILCSSYEDIGLDIDNKIILNFDDVVRNSSKSFSQKHASQIYDFIKNMQNINTLYICCDSGESRSSAIAAVLYRVNGKNEDIIWKNPNYHPNMLVYEILCNEFGIKNSKIRLKYKKI